MKNHFLVFSEREPIYVVDFEAIVEQVSILVFQITTLHVKTVNTKTPEKSKTWSQLYYKPACTDVYRVLKWWRHKNEISEIMGYVRIFWKDNVEEDCLWDRSTVMLRKFHTNPSKYFLGRPTLWWSLINSCNHFSCQHWDIRTIYTKKNKTHLT